MIQDNMSMPVLPFPQL